VWYYHKDKHVDKWKRIENPKNKQAHMTIARFKTKSVKTIQGERMDVFNK
jgi:hypothetical protein